MIINYAKITEENGAIIIIALNQEKAYNKIQYSYLWSVLEAFQIPQPFIRTIKAIYEHASTHVAINGVLSSPFYIYHSIRLDDPLLYALFNLAIEPLAYILQND